VHSPVELRVYDTMGRMTGLENGIVITEIPDSYYDAESESVIIVNAEANGVIVDRIELIGTDDGVYGLDVILHENEDSTDSVIMKEIPVTENEVHEWVFEWDTFSSESSENLEFSVKIDSDNDGDIDSTAQFAQKNPAPNSQIITETSTDPSDNPTLTGDDFDHALWEQNSNGDAAASGGLTFFGFFGILSLLIVAAFAVYLTAIAHRSGYNRNETIRNLEATITSLIGRIKSDSPTKSSIPPIPPGLHTFHSPGISTPVSPPPPSKLTASSLPPIPPGLHTFHSPGISTPVSLPPPSKLTASSLPPIGPPIGLPIRPPIGPPPPSNLNTLPPAGQQLAYESPEPSEISMPQPPSPSDPQTIGD